MDIALPANQTVFGQVCYFMGVYYVLDADHEVIVCTFE
jgi:hypothetical protein